MNRYTTNTQVADRRPTVVPLPFEQMYNALQTSQARYDQAEAFEIENNSKISALSSPIKGYQEYLDNYKTSYLQEAEALHKSNPDKGSPEYRRKLQELVGKYAADRTRQLIVRDSETYGKAIADIADLKKKGKFSAWRASNVLNFTGKDANGNILPFIYTGVEEALDTDKLMQQAVNMTGKNVIESEYIDPKTQQKIKTKRGGKDWRAIKANAMNFLGKEGMLDLMEKNGLKNEKELNNYLNTFAKASSEIDVSTSVLPDYSAEDHYMKKYAFEKKYGTPQRVEVNLGTIKIGTMEALKNKKSNFVNEDGSVKEYSPPSFGASSYTAENKAGNAGRYLAKDSTLNSPGINFYSQKQEKDKIKEQALNDPNFGPIIQNFKRLGMNTDEAIKKANEFINNHDNKQNINPSMFDLGNDEDKVNVSKAINLIKSTFDRMTFVDLNTGQPIKLDASEKLDVDVSGEAGPTEHGNASYIATINGKTVLAAYNSNDPADNLNKAIFDAKNLGRPQEVIWNKHPYYPDYDFLDGKKVEILLDLPNPSTGKYDIFVQKNKKYGRY